MRLPSLTGLRWFAAFAVFGFHIRYAPELSADPGLASVLDVLFGPGAAGVPFFFILSGLVLTWSARPGDRPGAFWRRRAARILPVHVVMWTGVFTVLAVRRIAEPGPALTGLVLIQAWIPDQAYYFGVNTPAWSLSCEMAFYAAFPLMLPLLRRVPANRLSLVAAGAFAAIWLVPVVSLAMPRDIAYWFVWVFPAARVFEFLLGMSLALLIREGRWRGPGLVPSAALVAAAYLAQPYMWERWAWVAWMSGPLALLVAAAASADVEGRRSLLRTPVLIRLGELSFAFYLCHHPVIRFGARLLRGATPSVPMLVAVAAGMLLLAVGLAWSLYHLVERPLEKRLSGRRRATGPERETNRPYDRDRDPAPATSSSESPPHGSDG